MDLRLKDLLRIKVLQLFRILAEVDSILEVLCISMTAEWLIVCQMMDMNHWPVLYQHNMTFWS